MRKIHKLLLMAALLLLVGCKPDDPVVTFVKYEPDPIIWREHWVEGEEDVQLILRRMDAIDQNVVFLSGEISMQSHVSDYRSVLLRSDNDGKNWHEVMPPEYGSVIEDIDFVGNGQGWALVTWTRESVGASKVFHTVDYGKTWDELSIVGGTFWSLLSFEMMDAQHGQIEFIFETGPPHAGYYAFVTDDGAVTWEQETFIPLEGDREQREALRNSWREGVQEERVPYQTGDGCEWKLEQADRDESYSVKRRLSPDDEWVTTAVIPIDYIIQDGDISLP